LREPGIVFTKKCVNNFYSNFVKMRNKNPKKQSLKLEKKNTLLQSYALTTSLKQGPLKFWSSYHDWRHQCCGWNDVLFVHLLIRRGNKTPRSCTSPICCCSVFHRSVVFFHNNWPKRTCSVHMCWLARCILLVFTVKSDGEAACKEHSVGGYLSLMPERNRAARND